LLLLWVKDTLFSCVDVCVVELLRGRIEERFELAESGEGPCALARAQERMRSRNDGESGEASFIDIETQQEALCVKERKEGVEEARDLLRSNRNRGWEMSGDRGRVVPLLEP
jgi:hypothetical protein